MKKREIEANDDVLKKEIDDLESKKKSKRRESVERRKSRKKIDKIARWSGFILLLVVLFVGFLMWVAGEMRVAY